MARIDPLWRSDEISLYRFDHPVEHEDRAYEQRAEAFRASFVEAGTFNLEVGESRWRVGAGDVMLSHPGMNYRASYDGDRFNDTCISLIYLAADEDRFDAGQAWEQPDRRVLPASNRLNYLRWLLQRAAEQRAPMLAEYVASEIFRDADSTPAALFRERKFSWYAERVHAAREQLDAEFERDHSVSLLARSVGMSAFHFTRVFTQLVGRPPHRYLTERRLTAAKSMLQQGRNVTETCYACGYGNLSHFSRSFGRRFGVPPSRVTG
jgi:AraC family transcriptional regulator